MSRFVLLGHPVSHSLSPAIHSAAYRALGLPHRYEVLDVPDEAALAHAVARLRSGEIAGANVTVPHKARALELADSADPLARETEAANVLSPEAGRLVAYNTDVSALVAELARLTPGATSAIVIGAGGAARAAVSACRARGMGRITVLARRFDGRADPAEAPGGAALLRMGASICPWPSDAYGASRVADAVSAVDVLIQATSAGMAGVEGDAIARVVPWEHVPASAMAYDVVYTPAVTPFLVAARARGLEAHGGLGMLVGQAASAVALWLGVEPPLVAMRAAAEEALAARERGEG